MKKLLFFLLFMGVATYLWAAAPSRSYTYTSGQTINPTHVTINEDNLFTYLQNGIEIIKDGIIVNADISGSAAIADSKLAQITTASKVNVSALTGTIVTAGTVSGIAVVGLDTIPASAGVIPAANIPAVTGFTDGGDRSSYDLTGATATMDNAWHDLDLSSLVTANSKTVLLRVNILDNTADAYIQFRENGNSNTYNQARCTATVASQGSQFDIIIQTDSNGIVEYLATEALIALAVTVGGYWN